MHRVTGLRWFPACLSAPGKYQLLGLLRENRRGWLLCADDLPRGTDWLGPVLKTGGAVGEGAAEWDRRVALAGLSSTAPAAVFAIRLDDASGFANGPCFDPASRHAIVQTQA
jgi:hypothetical protein